MLREEFEIPAEVRNILGRLNAASYEACLVGGCVRDLLRGEIPHDWDICTSALPDQIKMCFADHRMFETGFKHGTVTVMEGNTPYEVTTYRLDGHYSDGRHPDGVQFSKNLFADLVRRDFTINAIALDLSGRIQDPLEGSRDIAQGVIRCVGNPDQRFQEDGLRVMRALRFAAAFRYKIEEKTAEAIHRNKAMLDHVSAERIREEFCKLLIGPGVGNILREYLDIICQFWPDLGPLMELKQENPWHCWNGMEHTIRAVEAVPANLVLRLTMLLHDIGKPACKTTDENGVDHFYGHPVKGAALADQKLRELKFDNATRERVVQLIVYHDDNILPSKKSVRWCLNLLNPEAFFQLLEVKKADDLAKNPAKVKKHMEELQVIQRMAEEIIANRQCFSLKDLAVNGRDVMEAGVPKGPQIGTLLNILLEKVMNEEVPNERDALRKELKKIMG